MTERDTQRSKLYKAEQVLDRFAAPLREVADVEKYIARQMKRATLRARYGTAVDPDRWSLAIKDGRGTRCALAYGSHAISLPLWARKDWVVLHELAHVIHNRLSRSFGGSRIAELHGGASHGWQFAAIYLDLVRFCMGAEAHDALKASFKERKVRFRPKRSAGPATPEQKARLAALREAKRNLPMAAKTKGK